MKKAIVTFTLLALFAISSFAQNTLNSKADNIIGTYLGIHDNEQFKVGITKQKDGTFTGQVIWLEHDKDAHGNKFLDTRNPDKSLRNIPRDQIVLFSGLKYDAKEQQWGDTKIYDPQRGIRARLHIKFTEDGLLKLRGSVLGIGESVYWKKIK